MKACIATSKKPLDFPAFIEAVKASAQEGGNEIKGYVVMPGSGCWNHGVLIEGPDVENFLNHLTMALMPSKWSQVSDEDPGVSEGQFEFIPE